MFDLVIGNVPGVRDVFISQPVERTTRGVQTESQEKATKELTLLFTPLSDSGTEGVAKSKNETLHSVVKSVSSDRLDDSISPDDSVAVKMTIGEVTTSTAAEVVNKRQFTLTMGGLHATFTPHETKLTSTDLKPSLRQLLRRLWRRL